MTEPTPGLFSRLAGAFDRAFLKLANSSAVGFVSQLSRTPNLDLTLCRERLESEDASEIMSGLQWLAAMQTPKTAAAADQVQALTEHPDARVAARARETLDVLKTRFGPL